MKRNTIGPWRMTIPDIVPYVRTTQRQKFCDPRYFRYRRWKEMVRILGNLAGIPQELEKGARYAVVSCVYWRGVGRADLDNAGVKNVLDALWSQDRRVKALGAFEIDQDGSDGIVVAVRRMEFGESAREVLIEMMRDFEGRV